jgi:hypothetical protein
MLHIGHCTYHWHMFHNCRQTSRTYQEYSLCNLLLQGGMMVLGRLGRMHIVSRDAHIGP